MDSVEREMGLIAELALASRDLRSFELAWLDCLRPRIGFETACTIMTDASGLTLSAAAIGYPEATLGARFSQYMSELSPSEVAGFCAKRPAVDLEVVSSSRRRQLAVYRELLLPARVSSFVTNVWHARGAVFGIHLARCGRATAFRDGAVERLSHLLVCVRLGQALLIADEQRRGGEPDWWPGAWNLSSRESEVARLAARGFSNPEIARLLRVSPHTIRNQLSAVFRKALVSNRAELAFAMASPLDEARQGRGGRGRWSPAWSGFLAR
jgi:DNA-binding CsgD family transcriptional regulator